MQRNLISFFGEDKPDDKKADVDLDIGALSALFPSFQKIEHSFQKAHESVRRCVERLEEIESYRRNVRQEILEEYEEWERTVGKAFPSSPAFQCVRRVKDLAISALDKDDEILSEISKAIDNVTAYVSLIEEELAPIVNEVERLVAHLNVLERRYALDRKLIGLGGSVSEEAFNIDGTSSDSD